MSNGMDGNCSPSHSYCAYCRNRNGRPLYPYPETSIRAAKGNVKLVKPTGYSSTCANWGTVVFKLKHLGCRRWAAGGKHGCRAASQKLEDEQGRRKWVLAASLRHSQEQNPRINFAKRRIILQPQQGLADHKLSGYSRVLLRFQQVATQVVQSPIHVIANKSHLVALPEYQSATAITQKSQTYLGTDQGRARVPGSIGSCIGSIDDDA
ncbi:hypothetical protein EDD36DRAFT_414825 [Exophiala viscosa]|uniref:Uncharacterized protein n=1 Tax=Exophiala viscosa TaxID=2486360 RepID=A0AAN6IFB9_9EURO|nr:hypothetical protein EDD36DRAFT_414825 [Exophiala viscosa]